ncbi:MAG: glycine reductase [Lachnospiraceae bacterium]|nr:glycine reductase [Lachnospiraceae bacterium]
MQGNTGKDNDSNEKIAIGNEKIAKSPVIAITGMGSEHGEETSIEGALLASKLGVDVRYIGSAKADGVKTIPVKDEDEGHHKMEELLNNKEIDGAVTMHYPFPIGVATVGLAVTPSKGKKMFIATTTGTTGTDRIPSMVTNAICGIIAAKACGVKAPKVGILNIDGARQTEIKLRELKSKGYDISFADSAREGGGAILRGNDVLTGSADVLVCDSLTGNVLSKMLSAFSSGGSYETVGFGYGPGIGEGYDKLVLIISRASGAPVIGNALKYASDLVDGNVFEVANAEFKAANVAGLKLIAISDKNASKTKLSGTEGNPDDVLDTQISEPKKEPVTAQIAGIEIMDLEDGVAMLKKNGIYAESGMGCTGPIILVSEANLTKAEEELKKAGFIAE